MLNGLQTSGPARLEPRSMPVGSGVLAERLLAEHRGPKGLDIEGLRRDLASHHGDEALASAIEARLSPIERGELARAASAGALDTQRRADLDAALNAGGSGRSPEQARQIAEAFRRELDGAPRALGASASAEVRRNHADLRRASEFALLNVDVYNDRSNPALLPRGYSAVSDTQAQRQFPGFTPRDDRAGYHARVYFDGNTSSYVLVNRGTNDAWAPAGILRGTPDGRANGDLLSGNKTRQADIALRNASILDKKTSGKVTFSGHSLGGALASLQALRTGRSAIEFNPLGSNTQYARVYGLDLDRLDDLVRSYKVEGDPVAMANHTFGLRVTAQTTTLASREVSWSRNDGFQSGSGNGDPHSMNAVIGGLLHGMAAAQHAR